ncbi:DUF4232 domain-containing protein [Actinocrispum sp. NPDC049592]|uniref:DUF4232 domain-containing protein n=1 Tax=Actinocrispum sp. NPDC049592 TaxID=3154835 RepID=UPI00343024A1
MVRHRLLLAGAAIAALGTVAACGNSSPTAQSPQTVTVTSTPSAPATSANSGNGAGESGPTSAERPESVKSDATPRCTAATLKGEITGQDAGAGNRYAKLVVTNTGKANCTLYGYGGLALANASGADQPTKLSRSLDPKPSLITLAPGQKASKNLHWGAVPDGTEPTTGPCEPASAGINVIPPDEKQPFAVKYDFGSVCEHGSVDGSAYYK